MKLPSNINDIRLMASGVPRVHPNGFIQLNLDRAGITRLHVWPDEPLEAQKSKHTIHDHIFDMESTVIAGAPLVNLTFDLSPYVMGGYEVYQSVKVEGEDTVLERTGVRGDLIQTASLTVSKGESYTLPAFVLHDSVASNMGTATIMRKLRTYDQANARVAVPVGMKPDNDYRREANYSHEYLWEIITRVLRDK